MRIPKRYIRTLFNQDQASLVYNGFNIGPFIPINDKSVTLAIILFIFAYWMCLLGEQYQSQSKVIEVMLYSDLLGPLRHLSKYSLNLNFFSPSIIVWSNNIDSVEILPVSEIEFSTARPDNRISFQTRPNRFPKIDNLNILLW